MYSGGPTVSLCHFLVRHRAFISNILSRDALTIHYPSFRSVLSFQGVQKTSIRKSSINCTVPLCYLLRTYMEVEHDAMLLTTRLTEFEVVKSDPVKFMRGPDENYASFVNARGSLINWRLIQSRYPCLLQIYFNSSTCDDITFAAWFQNK